MQQDETQEVIEDRGLSLVTRVFLFDRNLGDQRIEPRTQARWNLEGGLRPCRHQHWRGSDARRFEQQDPRVGIAIDDELPDAAVRHERQPPLPEGHGNEVDDQLTAALCPHEDHVELGTLGRLEVEPRPLRALVQAAQGERLDAKRAPIGTLEREGLDRSVSHVLTLQVRRYILDVPPETHVFTIEAPVRTSAFGLRIRIVPRMTSHRFVALALLLAACTATDPETGPGAAGGKADDASTTRRRLPAQLEPWGGDDASRWTPEAIVANAVTPELQRDPAARVSVPLALLRSGYSPFGDGQTNAAASLAWWQQTRVPVIGIRHAASLEVRFDRALAIGEPVIELWSTSGTWLRSEAGARNADGDLVVRIVDGAVLSALGDRFVVTPRGWRDGFALAFAIPVTSARAVADALPASQRTLPGGEPVLDPVGAAGDDAAATLASTSFPAGFVNQSPYVTDTLHAAVPQGGTPRITAVGGAATWVATQPFENLYVCLDPRARASEAEHGVPSGAGWHHIGDPSETILSTLATSPLIVGHAEDVGATIASGGGAAYGLDRAATFALLQPGEAFTSVRGTFHWYAVHQDVAPCFQIWK